MGTVRPCWSALAVAAIGWGLGAAPAWAQGYYSYDTQPTVQGQFMGGYSATSGYAGGDFSAASVGLVYRTRFIGWTHLYGLAQIGISHVHLRLVQTFFVPGFYCDPYFGCDYPAVGAASVYVYNTNHLSWNVGLGVDFPSYWGQSWFIEAQYRRIATSPRSFDYWPIMVGLRF